MADIKAIAEALVNISSTEVKELADVLKMSTILKLKQRKKSIRSSICPLTKGYRCEKNEKSEEYRRIKPTIFF